MMHRRGRQRRRDHILNQGHAALMAWGEHRLRYQAGACIGYPSATPEGRAMRDGGILRGAGRRHGSRIPRHVMSPAHIRRIDCIVRSMPERLRRLVEIEYVSDIAPHHRPQVAHQQIGVAPSSYLRTLDTALAYVAGAMQTAVDKIENS